MTAALLIVPLLVVTLAACQARNGDAHFRIKDVSARMAAGGVNLRFDLDLEFSREARRALRNGVPLTIELSTELRQANDGEEVSAHTTAFQIRYLPLSDHYELEHEDRVSTWPRLRHLLAEVARSRVALQAPGLPSGSYEVLARCRLDKQKLPPPMRLPSLVTTRWRHDSGWTTWPVTLEDST